MTRMLLCLTLAVLGASVPLAAAPQDDPPVGQPAAPEAEPRWFKGNLHTHSLWSDGNDYPETLFEQPGRFLLIQGEEITDKFQSRPIHMNASNLLELIPPQGGNSVVEVMTNDLAAVTLRVGEMGVLSHGDQWRKEVAMSRGRFEPMDQGQAPAGRGRGERRSSERATGERRRHPGLAGRGEEGSCSASR